MLSLSLGSVLTALLPMNALLKRKAATAMLSVMFLTSGCLGTRMDNGATLIARDDFPAAANAAPGWVTEALDVIAELEHRLESQ